MSATGLELWILWAAGLPGLKKWHSYGIGLAGSKPQFCVLGSELSVSLVLQCLYFYEKAWLLFLALHYQSLTE